MANVESITLLQSANKNMNSNENFDKFLDAVKSEPKKTIRDLYKDLLGKSDMAEANLSDLLEKRDLFGIWEYIAYSQNERKQIKSLPVCCTIVKRRSCSEACDVFCKRLCECCGGFLHVLWKYLRCKCRCVMFEEKAQRLTKDDHEWLKILSNPLYIGLEWLWRSNPHSRVSDAAQSSEEPAESEDEDVIKAALRDSRLLQETARYEHHYSRESYKTLASQCEEFATDLIEECDKEDDEDKNNKNGKPLSTRMEQPQDSRDTEEQQLHEIMDVEGTGPLLRRSYTGNYLPTCESVNYDQSLSLLKYAADKKRKKFVTSPKCQSVLNEIIYYDSSWPDKNIFLKLLWVFLHQLLLVPLCLLYIPYRVAHLVKKRTYCPICCFKRSSCCTAQADDRERDDEGPGQTDATCCCPYRFSRWLKEFFEHPYSKFISHTTWFLVLLVVVFVSSFEYEFGSDVTGLLPLDYVVLAFVLGLALQGLLEMLRQGVSVYFSKWWNVVDTVIVLTFIAAYTVWLSAWIHYGYEWKPRKKSFVVADVLYSSATILAYFHMAHVFQVNSVLGPLQLSLYKMLKDVFKFLLIFLLLYIAFANGLTKVYSYYVASQIQLRRQNDTDFDRFHPYANHINTFVGLFWLLLGYVEESNIEIQDPAFSLTENFARLFLNLYVICTVIVALSMLIAMMNNSFDRIMRNADMEWKFSRARMWLEWIDKGNTLPSPLNTVVVLLYFLFLIVDRCFCGWICTGCDGCCKCSECCKEKGSRKMRESRKKVMQALVVRYLKNQWKDARKGKENKERDVKYEPAVKESPEASGEREATRNALTSIQRNLSLLTESIDGLRKAMVDQEKKMENIAVSKGYVNQGMEVE